MLDYDTEELARIDLAHVLHGNTNLYDYANGKGPLVLVRGEGAVVVDSTGREYIDSLAGLWNVNVGHGRKEIAQAIAQQSERLAYAPTILGLTNVTSTLLAKRLADITPEKITRFYFACGGAEANEAAFKIVRYFNSVQNRKQKVKIISRQLGYHGVAFATMTATGMPQFTRNFGPTAPGFVHIAAPYCYRCAFGKSYGQCDLECALALEVAIRVEGEDTVAAFVAEPVQGSGGVIVPPREYWPMVRDICTRHDVLLIADEIITGFGRTGTLFGLQHWGVEPDLMTMAKGITSAYQPLAAVGLSDEVFKGMCIPGLSFMHSYTYSGHPVACAAALSNIEILEKEGLVERAAEMGRYLNERLTELRDLPYVGETRGLGLMAAVEVVADKRTKAKFEPGKRVGAQVMGIARENGVLTRVNDDCITIAPPFVVTPEQIDSIIEAIRTAVLTLEVN